MERQHTEVADPPSRRCLLRRNLGAHTVYPDTPCEDAHLDVTCLRGRSRSSSVVSGGCQDDQWITSLTHYQILWGTSSLALYIPWAGGAGPYLGLSLWLWLGVLDAVQGVGLGMILLQVRNTTSECGMVY